MISVKQEIVGNHRSISWEHESLRHGIYPEAIKKKKGGRSFNITIRYKEKLRPLSVLTIYLSPHIFPTLALGIQPFLNSVSFLSFSSRMSSTST
jgi:hypothetical protein